MRNFHGQAGVRYSRQLLFFQTLFFVLLLVVSMLWALDSVGLVPRSPWTLELSLWLSVCVLAAWVIALSQATPVGGFTSARRTKVLVAVVTIGAIASSLLAVVLPNGGPVYLDYLVVSPIVLSALAVCSVSSLYVRECLRSGRRRKHRYDAEQAKLHELRAQYGTEAVARVELSHALELGDVAGNPLPEADVNVIAGLTSKPWHDTSEYAWVSGLEQAYEGILEELEEMLTSKFSLRPYEYLDIEGWDTIRFVESFRVNDEYCRQFPKTAEVLKSVPHYPIFRDAMFSVLAPGIHIPPHRDGSNAYLTCHLGLVLPSGCGIRVGGQTRAWEKGKCMIFDATYEHEAWNTSDQRRVVLVIDFPHPELTDVEVEWVAARKAAEFAQRA